MKKRYLYFLPAGIAVVLLTGLFYNRPAADTATPAAAGTEGQGLSEGVIETETITVQLANALLCSKSRYLPRQ